MTQRGSWYPSGELGNSSKHIIKEYIEENRNNRLILVKTPTNVEFHGEDNKININIENLRTIALWKFFWLNIFNPLRARDALRQHFMVILYT